MVEEAEVEEAVVDQTAVKDVLGNTSHKFVSFSAFSNNETLSRSILFWNSRSLFLVSSVFTLARNVLTSYFVYSREMSSFVAVFVLPFPPLRFCGLAWLSADVPALDWG